MKRKVLFFVILLAMLFTIAAQAITTRADMIVPSLSFNSTTATCVVAVDANSGDEIIVEAELLEDGDLYRHWTGSGTSRLHFKRTAAVTKGHTYTFSAEVTIDGETYSTRPITKTFN